MTTPQKLSYYKSLTQGGDCKVNLTQDEACIALKIHDYGVSQISESEQVILHGLIAKIKEEIWP